MLNQAYFIPLTDRVILKNEKSLRERESREKEIEKETFREKKVKAKRRDCNLFHNVFLPSLHPFYRDKYQQFFLLYAYSSLTFVTNIILTSFIVYCQVIEF